MNEHDRMLILDDHQTKNKGKKSVLAGYQKYVQKNIWLKWTYPTKIQVYPLFIAGTDSRC